MKSLSQKRFWGRTALMLSILVSSTVGFGQIDSEFLNRVDSLKTALDGSTGKARYDLLDKLAYEYVWVVDSIALPYAAEALDMSWTFGDSLRVVRSARVKGMIHNGLQEYNSTIAILERILPIARRNRYLDEVKRVLNLLAIAYTYSAQYDKALSYNFESLELRTNSGDTLSVSIALNNIGTVYYKIADYPQALYYFEKALELKDAIPELSRRLGTDMYGNTIFNLSLCHRYMNNLALATEYWERGNTFCKEGCSDHLSALMHFTSGLIEYDKGNLQLAESMFVRSLSYARRIFERSSELDNLIFLSKIGLATNDLVKAENYLLEAEPLFDSDIPLAELSEVYNQLGQIYTRLGNYRKATYYQSKFIDVSAKIYGRKLTNNLMKVQAEYLQRENKTKIEAQDRILALNIDIINRQRVLNIIVGIVAILSIALILALTQNVKQKRMANNRLEQRVKERTLELEVNRSELIKAIESQHQQIKRISTEIKSSLATIKGLCKLSLQDANVINAGQYIDKIEDATNNLQNGVLKTLGINENRIT